MTTMTFRETPHGYVDADGARMYRPACEALLTLWQTEHDALLRIGSIEAVCWARKIRKSWLALSFASSVVWPETPNVVAELRPLNCTIRTLDRKWAALPGDAA